MVKYFDELYLSTGKNATYEEIADLGAVKESQETEMVETKEGSVDIVSASLICASCFKVITENVQDKVFIKCLSCNMKQKMAVLKTSVTVVIKIENDDKKFTFCTSSDPLILTANGEESLALKPEDLEDYLLSLRKIFFCVQQQSA